MKLTQPAEHRGLWHEEVNRGGPGDLIRLSSVLGCGSKVQIGAF
jgi:hypothetical protein